MGEKQFAHKKENTYQSLCHLHRNGDVVGISRVQLNSLTQQVFHLVTRISKCSVCCGSDMVEWTSHGKNEDVMTSGDELYRNKYKFWCGPSAADYIRHFLIRLPNNGIQSSLPLYIQIAALIRRSPQVQTSTARLIVNIHQSIEHSLDYVAEHWQHHIDLM